MERARYGAPGWIEPRDFDASDLSISLGQLKSILSESSASTQTAEADPEALLPAPLRALRYMVAECNYGGRVTDEHDRRLLAVLLVHYFGKEMAFKSGYR